MSTEPSNPDYVIVDAGQLLYHIVWPSDGTVSTIATSMGARLQPCNALQTTVVFDRYGNVSAKDHERERRAIGVCDRTYNLTLISPLLNREVVMKSKANKILLSRITSSGLVMVQFLPSLRAWEPDCSPATHSRPQLCLTATAMCRQRITKGNDALSVCVIVLTTSLSFHLFSTEKS